MTNDVVALFSTIWMAFTFVCRSQHQHTHTHTLRSKESAKARHTLTYSGGDRGREIRDADVDERK